MPLRLMRFLRSTSGATAIEYGLMLALIAVVVIVAGGQLGLDLSATFNAAASHFGNTP